jgi:uncharacterized membrane protein YkvA (DUF1232 family)
MALKQSARRTSKAPVKKATRRGRPVKKVPPGNLDEAASSELALVSAKVGDAEVSKVVRDADKIERKALGAPVLDRFFGEIKMMLSMVKDFASGKYREAPFGTIAAIVGALLYLWLPLDLIPDFIPAVGFLDDAAVIRTCLALVAYDVTKYRDWRAA